MTAARRSAALVDRRNLRVLDADRHDGLCYVVNEWGQGVSLDSMLADEGPLPARQAAWLVAEVADTLAVAHSAGRAHGRLYPESVLVDENGQVRIIGFAVDAALHGLPADRREQDVRDLVGVLYAALTGRWPGPDGSSVPACAARARAPAAAPAGARRHPPRPGPDLRRGARPPAARAQRRRTQPVPPGPPADPRPAHRGRGPRRAGGVPGRRRHRQHHGPGRGAAAGRGAAEGRAFLGQGLHERARTRRSATVQHHRPAHRGGDAGLPRRRAGRVAARPRQPADAAARAGGAGGPPALRARPGGRHPRTTSPGAAPRPRAGRGLLAVGHLRRPRSRRHARRRQLGSASGRPAGPACPAAAGCGSPG